MCYGCNGAAAVTGEVRALGVQSAPYLAVPLPTGGSMVIPTRAPQGLPAVKVTARPFPWAWIVAGVVAFLVLTPSRGRR
jgi:hypothetical protein